MKPKKQPTYNVPFSHIGLHSYPEWYCSHRGAYDSKTFTYEKDYNYKDELPETPAFTFEATLEYQTYDRGRSSAVFWFESVVGEHVGKTFPVQMANMSEFIPLMDKGKITAKFLTRKQGANFGLELV
jgi:hypothetical protein